MRLNSPVQVYERLPRDLYCKWVVTIKGALLFNLYGTVQITWKLNAPRRYKWMNSRASVLVLEHSRFAHVNATSTGTCWVRVRARVWAVSARARTYIIVIASTSTLPEWNGWHNLTRSHELHAKLWVARERVKARDISLTSAQSRETKTKTISAILQVLTSSW